MKIYLLTLILLIFYTSFVLGGILNKEKRICADFNSQQQVQKIFNEDPVKYKQLDKNKNKIPCETYKYKK